MSLDSVSFWQRDAGLNQAPLGRRIQSHGTAIVGAGIVGLSIALHLKLLGYREPVAIYEGERVGFGGTGRSGGLLISDNRYVPNSEADVDYMRHIFARLGLSDLMNHPNGKLLGVKK